MYKFILFMIILLSGGMNVSAADLEFKAVVIAIHDGDSISILEGGEKVNIRLAAIDASEKASKHRWPQQPFADEARAALIAMIDNHPVDVECTGQESYRRPVCRIYACEDPLVLPTIPEHDAPFCPPGDAAFDVQRRMVAKGMAWSSDPIRARPRP